jgi:glycosyltransferase involved in cell wall biosynthesis
LLESQPEFASDRLPANVCALNYQREPEEFFKAMDIFVMASRQEPFARVNLEAASAGCAIIATSVDGNLEIFRHSENAILFQPGDAAGLAGAIVQLGDDAELRHRLSSQAREDAEQFTLERCHQAIEYEMLQLAGREQTG